MLVYATLIIQINFAPYPDLQDRKDKIPIHSTIDFDDITERFLFSLFDTSTTSQIIEIVCKIVLFLIAVHCFSLIIVTEVFCMQFLRIVG